MQESLAARDNSIMGSVEHAVPMLRNIAYQYRQDYDDLSQVAAETALKAYDRAQEVRNPAAYIHRAIHYAVLTYTGINSGKVTGRKQRLSDHYRIESFDAPRTSDGDLSLYDLVGEAAPVSPLNRDFSLLYQLLDFLPEIDRTALCMRFGLCGYGVHRPCEIARLLGISQHVVNRRIQRAKEMLREYAERRDLVERHL